MDEIIASAAEGEKQEVGFESSIKVNNLEFAYEDNKILNGINEVLEFKEKDVDYILLNSKQLYRCKYLY